MNKLFEHTASSWVRYKNYEWREKNGKLYLMLRKTAMPEIYDPMQCADDLVINALDIGLMIFRKEPQKKIQDAILSFARKYGLLGLMAALPTMPKFVEYKKVYLPKNEFLRDEVMDTESYMNLFSPFDKPQFRKKGMESTWEETDQTMIALIAAFHREPQAEVMSFLRYYGEPYDWLVKVFKDWAFTFMSSFLYYRDREYLDEDSLRLYKMGMAAFDGNAPTYHIELWEVPMLVWDFHSLLVGIRMLFSLALTDTKNPLRMCKNCQRAFIAQNSEDEFCSVHCKETYTE